MHDPPLEVDDVELVLPDDDEADELVPALAAQRPREQRPVQQSVSVAHVEVAARQPLAPSGAVPPPSLVSAAWHLPSSLQKLPPPQS